MKRSAQPRTRPAAPSRLADLPAQELAEHPGPVGALVRVAQADLAEAARYAKLAQAAHQCGAFLEARALQRRASDRRAYPARRGRTEVLAWASPGEHRGTRMLQTAYRLARELDERRAHLTLVKGAHRG